MKRIVFLSILFFLVVLPVAGQLYSSGVPFIRNYTPVETTGSEQNWAVVQDHRGVMYFGNNDKGVLEYDGVRWRNIPVANNSIIRSLAVDDSGTVYVGAVAEFGYLSPNPRGNLRYVSLSSRLDSAEMGFTNVWKTYHNKGEILFCSDQKTCTYYPALDSLFSMNNPEGTFMSFVVNGKFLQSNLLKGLLEIRNDSVLTVNGGGFFKGMHITSILPLAKDSLFIGPAGYAGFILNTRTGKIDSSLFSEETGNFLKRKVIYNGLLLPEKKIALATLYGGLVMLDNKGNLTGILNKETGLQDETILYLYINPDRPGKSPLWMAMNIGISKTEFNSPFRIFGEEYGLNGTINDIIEFNDTLHVATSSGVYYLEKDPSGTARFRNIGTINTQCWSFLVFRPGGDQKKKLLMGTITGLYDITSKKYPYVLDHKIRGKSSTRNYYLFVLAKSPSDTSTVYLGGNALTILKYRNGSFHQHNSHDLRDEVRSIAEDREGNLWVGTYNRGIFRFSFPPRDTLVKMYSQDDGLPTTDKISVYGINEELLFATPDGLYRYDPENDRFYPDSAIRRAMGSESCEIFRITEDADEDLWLSYEKEGRFLECILEKNQAGYRATVRPFLRLPNKSTDAIYGNEKGIVWLGKSTELYRFDKESGKDVDLPYMALIRKVSLDDDSVIFRGSYFKQGKNDRILVKRKQPEELIPSIKYRHNNISFQWSATFYEKEEDTEFRYRLEGYDNNWTKWSGRTEFTFTNLNQGSYTFHIQARNIYGTLSESGCYHFLILPPWYQTVLAYIVYVFLAIALIIVIVKLYTRKLKKENIKLEGIIAERTAEIRRQKKELTDSIEYASRIQRALLPSKKVLEENFPEHFILFKPRDIVSGDFYWMTQADHKVFVVAADCTGHGVPGAFMSMLGISFLNEIVNKLNIRKSNRILDELRIHVMDSLKQTGKEEDETKDGMDLALCVIDLEKKKIQYSGAYNPLYLVRPLSNEERSTLFREQEPEVPRGAVYNEEHILIQYPADKMPIGISEKGLQSFTSQELDTIDGYSLYMCSDGYIDQFGGPSGKKLMSKAFKKILLEIQNEPMTEQGNLLNKKIEEWMGNLAQIDDILVIGIRT